MDSLLTSTNILVASSLQNTRTQLFHHTGVVLSCHSAQCCETLSPFGACAPFHLAHQTLPGKKLKVTDKVPQADTWLKIVKISRLKERREPEEMTQ